MLSASALRGVSDVPDYKQAGRKPTTLKTRRRGTEERNERGKKNNLKTEKVES